MLRFQPVDGASRYAVEIENDAGRRGLPWRGGERGADGARRHARTRRDLLLERADAGQGWRGGARDEPSSRPCRQKKCGGATRSARSLASEGGTAAAALLAEVDRRLALYQEALNGFRAALVNKPR